MRIFLALCAALHVGCCAVTTDPPPGHVPGQVPEVDSGAPPPVSVCLDADHCPQPEDSRCLAASCDGTCGIDPRPVGQWCGEGQVCNDVGECVAAGAACDTSDDCDDADPCTTDVCSAFSATCLNEPACG